MATADGIINDERYVPRYILPDPLVDAAGQIVAGESEWERRRDEILRLFSEHVYGRTPQTPILSSRVESLSLDREVFQGKGLQRQIRLWFENRGVQLKIDVLLYYPLLVGGQAPFVVGLNFNGNHAIQPDASIVLSDAWFPDEKDGYEGNRASDQSRGSESSRWPVEQILSRGYGLATVCYNDIDPDYDDGFTNGVHALFDRSGSNAEWGAIGAWAWGLSRIMDYLDGDPEVDSNRVVVMGHSRLGKAALWAGAQDTRFGLVISNNSGCGGAALSRRKFGETVQAINQRFPHWFCKNFYRFNNHEENLPVDQHMLIALMAPRPVYIASAEKDLWADPQGEFLAGLHAAPVYRLLGVDGLAASNLPPLDEPILSHIGYHIRRGGHDVTEFDWDSFLNFADLHF